MKRLNTVIFTFSLCLFISFFVFQVYPESLYGAERPARSLTVVQPQNAEKYTGRMVRVRGKVLDVHKSPKAVFMNFGKDINSDFTAVIFKGNFKDFDAKGINPLNYKGKVVTVSGVVQKYKGRAEIVVMSPSQITAD